jgi:hypothetical protein
MGRQPRQTRTVAGEPGDRKRSRRVREEDVGKGPTSWHLADVLPQPPASKSRSLTDESPPNGEESRLASRCTTGRRPRYGWAGSCVQRLRPVSRHRPPISRSGGRAPAREAAGRSLRRQLCRLGSHVNAAAALAAGSKRKSRPRAGYFPEGARGFVGVDASGLGASLRRACGCG